MLISGITLTIAYFPYSEQDDNMVKQDRNYYVISGKHSTSKFVFEVKNNPQKPCGKPTPIYPTSSYPLYMARLSEGSDMETGRSLGREKNGATKILVFLGPQKTILAFFMHKTLSWKERSSSKQKSQTFI